MPPKYYTDGSSFPNNKTKPNRGAICVVNPNGTQIFFEFVGDQDAMCAEALAVLKCLQLTTGTIVIATDCAPIVPLINGTVITKSGVLQQIIARIKATQREFDLIWIPRTQNLAGKVISKFRRLNLDLLNE